MNEISAPRTQTPLDALIHRIDDAEHAFTSVMTVTRSCRLELTERQRVEILESLVSQQGNVLMQLKPVLVAFEGRLSVLQDQLALLGDIAFSGDKEIDGYGEAEEEPTAEEAELQGRVAALFGGDQPVEPEPPLAS